MTDYVRLLVNGGVPEGVLTSGERPASLERIPRYDGLRDTAGAEVLGRALAAQLKALGADAILIGEASEDVVLAFVVARELGINVIRSYVDEGLLVARSLVPNDNIILLTDIFRDLGTVNGMISLTHERGCKLVATAALFALDDRKPTLPRDTPNVVLYRVPAAVAEA